MQSPLDMVEVEKSVCPNRGTDWSCTSYDVIVLR